MTEKIVSKGFYTHPGIPNFVSAKQYVVIKKGLENQLFFRFENPKNETLTALSFSVDCYDADGNAVKTVKIEQQALKVKGRSCFVVNSPIALEPECVDFKVSIHCVSYGDYCYVVHGNDVEVVFEKQNPYQEIDCVPYLHKMGGHTHKSSSRTLHAPQLFFALFSLILIALFAVLGVKLYTFTRTEEIFSLNQVEYTFATENHKDGPIIIVGTKSRAGHIIVPDKIEGHDVVAVHSNAFSNSNAHTIEFKGSIRLEPLAFENASNLQSLYIESISSLGDNAFAGCTKLKKVVIDKDLESIGRYAFEGCSALESVSFPDTLSSIGDYAFLGCRKLLALIIPDATTSIGINILQNCGSLADLKTPFIGPSVDEVLNLRYFFANSSSRVKNLVVTKLDEIPASMFIDENSLETVQFSLPVTSIGKFAFNRCVNLTTFDISSETMNIGESAFENCSSLRSAVIPNGITSLNKKIFKGCSSLETVTLPSSLEYISEETFMNCTSLTALHIPASVTFIGSNALLNCKGLTALTLPFLSDTPYGLPTPLSNIIASGSVCKLQEFTLLSGNTLPSYAFENFKHLNKVTIPATITEIPAGCFYNCRSLGELNIPAMVNKIGASAFENCVSLKSVTIPEAVTTTGAYAFAGCSALKTARFTNSATTIENNVFAGCSSLTYLNLPSGLTFIPESMCNGCSAMETIIIPANVTSIYNNAFADCVLLKTITLPLGLISIGDYAFAGCESMPSFTFTSSVRSIGERAFMECKSLTSVEIPQTVTEVERCVFANCSGLESITAPFPTDYTYGATFGYYFSETTIPDSVKHVTVSNVESKSLPNYAFQNCIGMETLTLPNDINSIGTKAFYNCVALTNLVIPDSVTSIGYGALINTTALQSITLPYAGCASSYYADGFKYFYYDTNNYTYVLPENLATVTLTRASCIPTSAFEGMDSIRQVNLPNSLSQIGSYAFYNCTSLREIVLPISLQQIDANAFQGCRRLYEVTNLSSYLTVSSNQFPFALRIFSSVAEKELHTVIAGSFTFLHASDGEWYLTKYDEDSTALALPSNVYFNYEPITYGVPAYLFWGNSNLETVNISSSVTKIKANAFSYCENLATVTADSTTVFKEIGAYAFYNSNLSSIEIPNSTQFIDTYAFAYTNLEEITIPATVEYIASYAFYENNSFSNVTFTADSTLSNIGEYAFAYSGLQDISIPASLISIGPNAFYCCSSLASVDFASNGCLASVGSYAFAYTEIESLSLPMSLTGIGYNAFYCCSSLESVDFATNAQLTSIGNSAFAYTAITNLSLPASLTSIGYNAFSYCEALTSVTVRNTFNSNTDAFAYSNHILEVYNLAGLPLVIGSSNYGGIAKNAMIIHTNADAEALHDVQIDNKAFKKSGTHWFLMGFASGQDSSELVLDSFTYNGAKVSSYIIYKNAFNSNYYLTSITIGDAVREIMDYAFYCCDNVRTLTFDEDCSVITIGENAFKYCQQIQTLILPERLMSIGNNAFDGCSALEVVVLPDSLQTIGSSAFYNCYRLYDVVNLSDINVIKGNTNNGYVGYYALAVHGGEPLAVTTMTTSNVSANFVNYNNSWYLVRLTNNASGNIVEIPELIINGKTSTYQIFACSQYSISSYSSVLIPKSVSKIDSAVLSNLRYCTIYFGGDTAQWAKLNTSSYTMDVYTYVNCIHESGMKNWMYDKNGNVSTATIRKQTSIISEPTCKDAGTMKVFCPVCGEEEMKSLPSTNEHNLIDDTCTVCGKVRKLNIINITSTNFGTCKYIANNSANKFAIDSEGVITSQNHGDSSTSTMTITAEAAMTIEFSYKVSSESNYDKFSVSLNGSQKFEISGDSGENTNYKSITITMNVGDVLTFTYKKDYSVNRGNDCAYIKGLTITTTEMVEASL